MACFRYNRFELSIKEEHISLGLRECCFGLSVGFQGLFGFIVKFAAAFRHG